MGQSIVAKEFTTVTDDSSAVLGPPASIRIDREMPQKLRDFGEFFVNLWLISSL
jgi:hypothetical protein